MLTLLDTRKLLEFSKYILISENYNIHYTICIVITLLFSLLSVIFLKIFYIT